MAPDCAAVLRAGFATLAMGSAAWVAGSDASLVGVHLLTRSATEPGLRGDSRLSLVCSPAELPAGAPAGSALPGRLLTSGLALPPRSGWLGPSVMLLLSSGSGLISVMPPSCSAEGPSLPCVCLQVGNAWLERRCASS